MEAQQQQQFVEARLAEYRPQLPPNVELDGWVHQDPDRAEFRVTYRTAGGEYRGRYVISEEALDDELDYRPGFHALIDLAVRHSLPLVDSNAQTPMLLMLTSANGLQRLDLTPYGLAWRL